MATVSPAVAAGAGVARLSTIGSAAMERPMQV
jgi:hypothetical protein